MVDSTDQANYSPDVDMDRRTPNTHPATAGYESAPSIAAAMADRPMRDVLVAGGLRGFTPSQMYPEAPQ